MPELDYALLCDYVRVDHGLAHVVAAGIDTISAPELPTSQNVGLLMRLTFSRNECGRQHRVEAIFQDADGERLAVVDGSLTPDWQEGLPVGWRSGALMGINLRLPLPRYGEYALELLVNDNHVKTLQLRCVPTAGGATA